MYSPGASNGRRRRRFEEGLRIAFRVEGDALGRERDAAGRAVHAPVDGDVWRFGRARPAPPRAPPPITCPPTMATGGAGFRLPRARMRGQFLFGAFSQRRRIRRPEPQRHRLADRGGQRLREAERRTRQRRAVLRELDHRRLVAAGGVLEEIDPVRRVRPEATDGDVWPLTVIVQVSFLLPKSFGTRIANTPCCRLGSN